MLIAKEKQCNSSWFDVVSFFSGFFSCGYHHTNTVMCPCHLVYNDLPCVLVKMKKKKQQICVTQSENHDEIITVDKWFVSLYSIHKFVF